MYILQLSSLGAGSKVVLFTSVTIPEPKSSSLDRPMLTRTRKVTCRALGPKLQCSDRFGEPSSIWAFGAIQKIALLYQARVGKLDAFVDECFGEEFED